MASVGFKHGDVVWVPAIVTGQRIMWPAKFLKQTNRPDICMVVLYGTRLDEFNEQFLVDTDEIVEFDKFEIPNLEGDGLHAYQLALQDFNALHTPNTPQPILTTSLQLCDFIQTILISQFLSSPTNRSEPQQRIIPRLQKKQIPLSNTDLKLYYQRMLPQMLNYLLLICQKDKNQNFRFFIQQTKNKIIRAIMGKLEKNQICFM